MSPFNKEIDMNTQRTLKLSLLALPLWALISCGGGEPPSEVPAPVVPATGVSPAVNVAVGGAGTTAAPTLLTYRTANWTFAYTPSASVPAGVYSGQITFTASAP